MGLPSEVLLTGIRISSLQQQDTVVCHIMSAKFILMTTVLIHDMLDFQCSL